MQKAYLTDYTITEFEATIKQIVADSIVLPETYFFPGGGHQTNDTGTISSKDIIKKVISVYEKDGVIYHQLDSIDGLVVGDTVDCSIDKLRRVYLSTLHTAQHIISKIVADRYNIHTVTSEFDVNGGNIVFSSPLQLDWVDYIINEFDAVIKKNCQIINYVDGNNVVVRIKDFNDDNCCGTHLTNTSNLSTVFIFGLGRKNHVLLYDVFSDFGNLKKHLKDYYKAVCSLGFKTDVHDRILHLMDEHSLLRDELHENCKNTLDAQFMDEGNFRVVNNYKMVFICLYGGSITKKAYKKVLKNYDCSLFNIDLCVVAMEGQYTIEAFNDSINVKIIMEKLKDKNIDISKGGGSVKKIDIVTENEITEVFDAIKAIVKEAL